MNRLVLVLLLVPFLPMRAQERRLRLVEWNVENLFDTVHDVGFNDREFLPDGAFGWDTRRYFTKLSMVSRTIAALGGVLPVDLIALCEVENDSVLVQLTRRSLLARLGYEYVMTHGRDPRGIDVALLYQPLSFRPFSVRSLRVPQESAEEKPLRDILFVSGEIASGDTLHVFVCHLSSRLGGARATEPFRVRAAGVMRGCVDSLFADNPNARIVITGDFNDEPQNASIAKTLRAVTPPKEESTLADTALYVLTTRLKAADGVAGTYKFRGRWNRLDNVLVSTALLRSTGRLHTSERHCSIGVLPHLVERDSEQGGVKPRRAFLGTQWSGGVSDHLPIVLDLYF